VIVDILLGALACLSLALLLWQWLVARQFPLHRRAADRSFAPAVALLKPLKGADAATEDCLRSWFAQNYSGEIQILFGIAAPDDPAAAVARKLLQEFSQRDAQLFVCGPPAGANAKVSKLVELEKLVKHDLLIVSDADVRVPPDFLANAVDGFREPSVGLVNCFYRLANPTTLAMQCEAIAINADFWSQVLQAKSLKPLDFALGAVMAVRRRQLEEIGGFKALADCLADDYQLGHRIAAKGHRIALCPVVVECWDPPMNWRAVLKHQLRWARTIRVSQPAPYFFSVLSNPTFWPLLWCLVRPGKCSAAVLAGALCLRIVAAFDLQRRLTQSFRHVAFAWFAPLKDLLQFLIWLGAFAGNRVEWRGRRFKLRRDGTLEPE
jgi:ceramide glucosyltransferase